MNSGDYSRISNVADGEETQARRGETMPYRLLALEATRVSLDVWPVGAKVFEAEAVFLAAADPLCLPDG